MKRADIKVDGHYAWSKSTNWPSGEIAPTLRKHYRDVNRVVVIDAGRWSAAMLLDSTSGARLGSEPVYGGRPARSQADGVVVQFLTPDGSPLPSERRLYVVRTRDLRGPWDEVSQRVYAATQERDRKAAQRRADKQAAEDATFALRSRISALGLDGTSLTVRDTHQGPVASVDPEVILALLNKIGAPR